MIDLAAFSDELQKIAAKRGGQALYSPGVVAHEAGHAVVHKKPGVTHARRLLPFLTSIYSSGRLGAQAAGGPGMSGLEFGAVSALGNTPVIADEAASSVIALRSLKKDKKMSKKDWKRTALQLAAINSSYMASPLMDVATVAAAKGGAHPLIQLGMQLAAKPVLGQAWGVLGTMVKGPKVNAKRAKEIVQATAPGTPVFVSKKPMPQGSQYVPPSGKSKTIKGLIAATYGEALGKKDLRTLQSKGGVLLAPLDPKAQAKAMVPGLGPSMGKFRRVT